MVKHLRTQLNKCTHKQGDAIDAVATTTALNESTTHSLASSVDVKTQTAKLKSRLVAEITGMERSELKALIQKALRTTRETAERQKSPLTTREWEYMLLSAAAARYL